MTADLLEAPDTEAAEPDLLTRALKRVRTNASGQGSGMTSGQESGEAPTGTEPLAPAGASVGACVLLPYAGDQYLLERNPPDHDTAPGKLRPPGGGAQPHELGNLESTIVREMREEFMLSSRETRPGLKLLGYQTDGQYRGSAVFELKDHGLKPGVYQATNSASETVTLEPARLSDPDYVGPQLEELSPTPP